MIKTLLKKVKNNWSYRNFKDLKFLPHNSCLQKGLQPLLADASYAGLRYPAKLANLWVWGLGAALGIAVGWYFTGLRDTLESLLTPDCVKIILLSIHILFGILILLIIRRGSSIEKFVTCLGLTLSCLLAPLPAAVIGIYGVLPLLSDLSLVYDEETINFISDFAIVLLPLFLILFTTVIFSLLGKAVTRLLSHSPLSPQGKK